MRLQADGRLTIGKGDVYADGAQLDIKADNNTLSQDGKCAIRLDDGNQALGKVLTSDDEGRGTWQDPAGGGGGGGGGKFVDGADPTDAVYLDGDVGIGTDDPDALLHLSSPASSSVIRLENREYDNGWDLILGSMEFVSQDGNVEAQTLNPVRARVNGVQQNTSVGAALHFYTANSLEVEPSVRMRIIADGAVHIGTIDDWPTAKLDVSGNARIRVIDQDDTLDQVLVSDTDGNIRWRASDTIGGGGPCTPCAEFQTAVFEGVCKIFEGEIGNVAQVTECVRVIAQLTLVGANICETDCLTIILDNVDELIAQQSQKP